jgi:hypothetical protein
MWLKEFWLQLKEGVNYDFERIALGADSEVYASVNFPDYVFKVYNSSLPLKMIRDYHQVQWSIAREFAGIRIRRTALKILDLSDLEISNIKVKGQKHILTQIPRIYGVRLADLQKAPWEYLRVCNLCESIIQKFNKLWVPIDWFIGMWCSSWLLLSKENIILTRTDIPKTQTIVVTDLATSIPLFMEEFWWR